MVAAIHCNSIPRPAPETPHACCAVVGIGNPLMGDDGAGIAALEQLQAIPVLADRCFFFALRHDLFEVADVLDRAGHFIFIDACIGPAPGAITVMTDTAAFPMPSLHQADIGTVMRMLEPLGLVEPFPSWELWGIAVTPPLHLGAGLSAPVEDGVRRAVSRIAAQLASTGAYQVRGTESNA